MKAEVLRYLIAGLINTAIYIGSSLAFSAGGCEPATANQLAYLVALPASFAGHRLMTFRSYGAIRREMRRFLSMHLLNLVMIEVVGTLMSKSHFDPVPITATLTILMTSTNYVMMKLWVFQNKS